MQPSAHVALAVLALTSLGAAQGKNLLFYGNSFSFFNGGVAPLVRAIAIEAGYQAPVYQERLAAGQDLHFHATDPAQVAAIGNFLPPGQTWDAVVVQGLSTEATQTLGNPTNFIANAVAIVGNVRSHSPAAKAVLYQTFARAQGHSFYPTSFAGPLVMHAQLRANYRQAATAIDTTFGVGTAVNAAVGDCAALLEFDPSIYFVDLHHPANDLTVMASMCLFTAIYADLVSDITPSFSPPSPLGALLNNYGIGAAGWARLAGIADTCAPRTLRPHPGSGDQLLLELGNQPGLLSAGPRRSLTVGNQAQIRLRSRNGVFASAPALVLIDLFPTGQPPLPLAAFPELAVDANALSVLLSAADLQNPLQLSVAMPFALPGVSLLVQGLAWQTSSETGNPWFTTSEGLEFVLQ